MPVEPEELNEEEKRFADEAVKQGHMTASISFEFFLRSANVNISHKDDILFAEKVGLLLREIIRLNDSYVACIKNQDYDPEASPVGTGNGEYVKTQFGMFRWKRNHGKDCYAFECLLPKIRKRPGNEITD